MNEKTIVILSHCILTYTRQGTQYVVSRSSIAKIPMAWKMRPGSQDLSENDSERIYTTTLAKTVQSSLRTCGGSLLGTESSEETVLKARTQSALQARRSIG